MKSRVALLSFVLLCYFATASAQLPCWTAAGSAGTVDESDLKLVELSLNAAEIKGLALPNTVRIRYNVVATGGILGGERRTKTLTVRFADNGNSAQVVVRLYALNLISGVSSTLVEFNSNDYPSSNVDQKQAKPFNCGEPEFDFEKNIYYIEVQLIKTHVNGRPLIRGIQICGNGIC